LTASGSCSRFIFIDFDHVIKDGKIAQHIERFRKKLLSYTELSPSGEGLHLYGLGVLPGGAGRKRGGIELYDRARFATLTGWIVPESKIHANYVSAGVEWLLSEHFGDREASAVIGLPAEGLGHTDEQVAELCAQHVGQRFAPLFREGPGKLNPSDADFSLAVMLAFYCGYDPVQIERIFQQSSLALRDKWRRRPDYRRMTITKAIAALNGKFYTPEEPVPRLPDKDRSCGGPHRGRRALRQQRPRETAGLYDVSVKGAKKPIRCDGMQFRNLPYMAAQMGHVGVCPPPIKQELWLKLISPWYEKAEERELPPQATERGKLAVLAFQWLRRSQNLYREPTLADRRDLLSQLPVKVEIEGEPCIAFRFIDLQRHLKIERYEQPRGGHAVFCRILMELGAYPYESDDFAVPGTGHPMSVWLMPIAAMTPDEEQPTPYNPEPPC
jgi:hypothetical protein